MDNWKTFKVTTQHECQNCYVQLKPFEVIYYVAADDLLYCESCMDKLGYDDRDEKRIFIKKDWKVSRDLLRLLADELDDRMNRKIYEDPLDDRPQLLAKRVWEKI